MRLPRHQLLSFLPLKARAASYFHIGAQKLDKEDSSGSHAPPAMPAMRSAKRREQSRSAAKCRRLTESEVYLELANVLPNVDQQTVYQADRIGLLRLASMVCRTRRLMARLFPSAAEKVQNWNAEEAEFTDEISVARCLDGFVLVVNKAGQFVYVSVGVSSSIGFTQIDLAGKYFRDYVHNDDWNALCQQLRVSGSDRSPSSSTGSAKVAPDTRIFFRMKTAMTPRGGRARKLTMAVYQPMHAYIIDPSEKLKGPSFDGKSATDEDIRILFCIPFLLSPLQKSFSTLSSSKLACTRHEVDMRLRFCSDKLASALQYGNAKKLVGQSFYDFVYPEDLPRVAREFKQMYKNGHTSTMYYRLSTSSGGHIWVLTEAALLVQNIRGITQKSAICNHVIISSGDCWSSEDQTLKPRSSVIIANASDLAVDPERTLSARDQTPPQIAPPHSQQRLESLKNEGLRTAECSVPTTSMPLIDPFAYKPPTALVGLPEERPDFYPYITPPIMDKYSLLCMGGAVAKPFEFNSILMAAMGATFPFGTPAAHPAKLFSATKPYTFPPIPMLSLDRPNLAFDRPAMGPPPDLSHLVIARPGVTLASLASSWTPAYSSPFQPYPPSTPGLLPKGVKTPDVGTTPDDAGRRHRLDAKTIESFEVAMIKNELAVGNE